jgi:hypothetical protein
MIVEDRLKGNIDQIDKLIYFATCISLFSSPFVYDKFFFFFDVSGILPRLLERNKLINLS